MTISNIELLNLAINNRLTDVNICMPGEIVSYDYTQQRAKVQPALNQKYNNGEVINLPIIHNVPVIHPASGGASITFPVNTGDNVMLVFSQKSLEEWLSSGEQVTPDDPRQNDLTDAIAILGLRSFSEPSPAGNNTDLLVKYDGSEIALKPNGEVNVKATEVNILGTNEVILNSNTEVRVNSPEIALTASTEVSVTDPQVALIGGTETSITAPQVNINGVLNINNNPYLGHTHSGVSSGTSNSGPVTS